MYQNIKLVPYHPEQAHSTHSLQATRWAQPSVMFAAENFDNEKTSYNPFHSKAKIEQ
jgi:hypothetical protein